MSTLYTIENIFVHPGIEVSKQNLYDKGQDEMVKLNDIVTDHDNQSVLLKYTDYFPRTNRRIGTGYVDVILEADLDMQRISGQNRIMIVKSYKNDRVLILLKYKNFNILNKNHNKKRMHILADSGTRRKYNLIELFRGESIECWHTGEKKKLFTFDKILSAK